ncbi:MAG: hypothetical protein H7245_24070 [Candidatus Saccharibacteria bacterium]|nr:hypothetical protein [Pseudorhodobacter sp.]
MAAADFRLRSLGGSGTCQNWHVCIYVAIGVMQFSGFAMAYFAASDVVIGAKAEGVLTMSTRFSFLRGVHLAGLVVLARLLILHLVGARWHRLSDVMVSWSRFRCSSGTFKTSN